MRYEIKGELAKLNEHDNANRTNRFGGAGLKKKMDELVIGQLEGKKPITRPCIITFYWFYSSRHDFDNIAFGKKYVLDGMQKAGVLPNDNQKWVRGFGGDWFTKVEPGEEKVLVEVEELEEGDE